MNTEWQEIDDVSKSFYSGLFFDKKTKTNVVRLKGRSFAVPSWIAMKCKNSKDVIYELIMEGHWVTANMIIETEKQARL